MRKGFTDENSKEMEVVLKIRVPYNFDSEMEARIDEALADTLFELGYELVDSHEYREIPMQGENDGPYRGSDVSLGLFYDASIHGSSLYVDCWKGEPVEIFLAEDGGLMCLLPDEDEPRALRDKIQEVEPGDAFLYGDGGSIRTSSEAAHQNFDEPDNPWILYDDDGDCCFEEDFGRELGAKVRELLVKIPARDIENATYVSVWDGGYAVETACKVNRQTGEVFDIEVSDVDADGLNVLDEEYVRFADGTRRSVVDGYLDERWPLRNYDDAVGHLCEAFNRRDWEMDTNDVRTPIKTDEFVPIFMSENYFGIYCWHNDENQYYLVDRNSGEHKMVLGDSFEFVGQNTLDCLKGEKILHVANREWLKYLVDFSLDNVKGVFPESELCGLAVLESAWREACKEHGGYVMGVPLAERIKMATEKVEGKAGNSKDVVDVELDKG